MNIKSSIGKKVSEAVTNCHKVLVEETINLLKQIGAEQGDDVLLKRMLILFQSKPDGTSETIVCNRISYAGRKNSPYYIISMGNDEDAKSVSDFYLSLSNLQIIYEEVRRVVREC